MFDELDLRKYFKQIINFKFYYVKYFRVFKVSYLQRNKNAITWKPLFRKKLTFLSKLDLSDAIA